MFFTLWMMIRSANDRSLLRESVWQVHVTQCEGRHERDRSDSPSEHDDEYEQHLTGRREITGDAGRQPNRCRRLRPPEQRPE